MERETKHKPLADGCVSGRWSLHSHTGVQSMQDLECQVWRGVHLWMRLVRLADKTSSPGRNA